MVLFGYSIDFYIMHLFSVNETETLMPTPAIIHCEIYPDEGMGIFILIHVKSPPEIEIESLAAEPHGAIQNSTHALLIYPSNF